MANLPYKREIIIFVISLIICLLIVYFVGVPTKDKVGTSLCKYYDKPITEILSRSKCIKTKKLLGVYEIGCAQYKKEEYTFSNKKNYETSYLSILILISFTGSFGLLELVVYQWKKKHKRPC